MRRAIMFSLACFLATAQVLLAESSARIKSTSGDVKIRRGVEETWHPASAGTELEEIDSILTGEGGQVVLELTSGETFRLNDNAILDIADLRRLTEKELFLVLMSRKIQKMEQREQKTKLRTGRVNVVHGELKTASEGEGSAGSAWMWQLEKNGALALYGQSYTTNSILKLNNIISKYPSREDCGEVHYHLGKALEKLDKPGQALDAYKAVLQSDASELCRGGRKKSWVQSAEEAMQRLGR